MFYLSRVAWSALPTATQLEPKTALLSSWKMSGEVNQEAGGVLAAATPTPGSQRSTSCWRAASLSFIMQYYYHTGIVIMLSHLHAVT